MKEKIKLNIATFILLIYTLFIVINDCLCFAFSKNSSIIFYILSLVICFGLCFFLRRKFKIVKLDFDKIDIVFLLFILSVFLVRFAIPDSSFDTLNYHLYSQERLFSNNTSYNFFPARWINTFSLPLADRMHYFFRYLFGYRLGILANLFCIIIIYYQIKQILKKLNINKNYAGLISVVILVTEQILANMLTYYVDLFSIPFLLEIIIVLLNYKKVNNIINFIVLFMAGVLVSIKVSNAFLLIPLVIIYIKKYRKDINWKTIVFGILIFIFPMFVYLLNNYIQTGNPVFPFYNSIFKTKYLPKENWIERFYGPKTLKERLLWPIYLFKYPRKAFDTDIYYGRIGFGYIVAILISIKAMFYRFKKKIKINELEWLSILYIVLCLIWSNFMMGYIRYALVLEVLSGIIMAVFLYRNFYKKRIINTCISIVCIFAFMYTGLLTISNTVFGTNESSWRYPYYMDKKGYSINFEYIFNRSWDYSSQTAMVDCYGIVDYNAGYAALLSKNKRIVGLNEAYKTSYGNKKSDSVLKECKNIYTISTSVTLERTEKYLGKVGYKRKSDNISFKADFLNYNNNIIIFEIEKK